MTHFSREVQALANKLAPAGGAVLRRMVAADLDEVIRIIRLHDSDDARAARVAFAQARYDEPEQVGMHAVLIEPTERRLVGVSGYYVDDLEARGVYWLGWTYVNPFFRGKGHGKVLMEFVAGALQLFGARKLYLSTSSLPKYGDAVRFYERSGFVEEGRLKDFFRDGEDKLIMGRRLTPGGVRAAPPTPAKTAQRAEDDEVTFSF